MMRWNLCVFLFLYCYFTVNGYHRRRDSRKDYSNWELILDPKSSIADSYKLNNKPPLQEKLEIQSKIDDKVLKTDVVDKSDKSLKGHAVSKERPSKHQRFPKFPVKFHLLTRNSKQLNRQSQKQATQGLRGFGENSVKKSHHSFNDEASIIGDGVGKMDKIIQNAYFRNRFPQNSYQNSYPYRQDAISLNNEVPTFDETVVQNGLVYVNFALTISITIISLVIIMFYFIAKYRRTKFSENTSASSTKLSSPRKTFHNLGCSHREQRSEESVWTPNLLTYPDPINESTKAAYSGYKRNKEIKVDNVSKWARLKPSISQISRPSLTTLLNNQTKKLETIDEMDEES